MAQRISSARRLSMSGLLIALSLFLGACEKPLPLRIGSVQWPGYEPLFLARDSGLYRNDDIVLVEMPSASDVMQHLRNGSLEGAGLTLDEVLTLRAGGLDLVVVAVLDVSHGADALIARTEIAKLADLRGKRVGVELSAVGALMLDAVLDAAALRKEDLTLVPLTIDEQLTAFENRRVDAVITFDPTRSRLLANGARQLFDSSRIPGRIVDVLAVRRDVLNHQPDALRALLRGYFSARALLRADPEGSAARMAPRLGISTRQLLASFAGMHLPDLEENRQWLKTPGARIEQVARALASLMLNQGLIDTPPPPDGLHDGHWLPAKP